MYCLQFFIFRLSSLFFLFSVIYGDSFVLKLTDIRPTMDKMFFYHIENKDISPLLLQRSLKIYMHQCDPEKIYLLRGEVQPFLHLNQEEMLLMIDEYRRDQFSRYLLLNQTIQQSIKRHQRLRKDIIHEIIEGKNFLFNNTQFFHYQDFASSEEELKKRVFYQYAMKLSRCIQRRRLETITPQLAEQILNYFSKKMLEKEMCYLDDLNRDHYLTLHILKSLAKSLDAHSGYYSPEEAYEIRSNLKRQFSGIGVRVREEFDGVFIESMIDGSPAQKNGYLMVGDRLIALEDIEIKDLSFKQITDMMKGQVGSELKITIERALPKKQIVEVKIMRDEVVLNHQRLSLSIEPFGDGVLGRLNLPGFYDNGGSINSADDLKKAFQELNEHSKVYGVILDLRLNSGGFLSQAIKSASLFLNGGLIVVSKYANGQVRYVRDVNPTQTYRGALVILTSKASASAAEIVAQTLQDHGVAIVVGDKRTYGKGSLQHQTLTDEHAHVFFKVTVGRYYTASGRSPQIEGVQSDIIVPTCFYPYYIGERYLEYPLKGDCLKSDLFHALIREKTDRDHALSSLTSTYLKPRDTKWRHMLLKLRQNSRIRLDQDRNFQFFMKKPYLKTKQEKKMNYGESDLQLKEATEILKDMILIDRAGLSFLLN